ncbi:MAG: helix-turn-helix domain-containing protein [Bdellovibrio sp.]|jgi:transcriptional regulator of acetoin/glycerol metabolism
MARTTVYIVSDETEVIERAKTYFTAQGVNVQAFSPMQWHEGMENPSFRSQMSTGMPALMTGLNPLEKSNVLPFPGAVGSSSSSSDLKVATMNELEAKAIENAIVQYRGNLTEAAKALGIGRATLYRKVKQYQIDPSMARKKRAA